jgi:nitroimidazol reductase NimA-like FMN-containing flavoprotein (pyridoxamine 5'-phosphate oxidase superfamily)
MLRKERERNDDAFLQDVLNRAEVVTIAFSDEDGPYVIPVNFVHTHGGICFHCALKGHKLDCMAREPRVGFSVYCDVAIDRKLATTRYSSISGSGNAEMVVDVAEKQEILELCNIFGARILDATRELLTIEICGGVFRLTRFLNLMQDYDVTMLTRSGKIAVVKPKS